MGEHELDDPLAELRRATDQAVTESRHAARWLADNLRALGYALEEATATTRVEPADDQIAELRRAGREVATYVAGELHDLIAAQLNSTTLDCD